MSSVIRNCEAIPPRFISCDGLDLTIKFLPSYGASVTYGDLMNVLVANGISANEVKGIYKVSASDSTFSVLFNEKATVNHLSKLGKISTPKFKFDLVHMSQQVIKFRVHWLPLYYDDTMLKGIFCDYGEILDIKRLKTVMENNVFLNGIREVTMKVDEADKMKIPHLINFGCGQTVLVTMQGRPPLCLKCRQVGHVRRDCGTKKQFSSLFKPGVDQRVVMATGIDPRDTIVAHDSSPTVSTSVCTSVSMPGTTMATLTSAASSTASSTVSVSMSEPTVTTSASEPRPTPSSRKTTSTLVSPELDSAQSSQPSQVGTSPHLHSDDVEMTSALSQKRSFEASDSQNFFTPNKTAKPQPAPDLPELSQANAFDLFGSTSDLDLDSDDNTY